MEPSSHIQLKKSQSFQYESPNTQIMFTSYMPMDDDAFQLLGMQLSKGIQPTIKWMDGQI